MDMLALAKDIAGHVKTESLRAQVPMGVSVIDVHGNTVLQHRMNGALAFSMLISERKVYTSALTQLRTSALFDLVQPGKDSFI
ncbi:heme-binding protein [Mesorhizobium sp. L2C084A000]|uniref:GlcG/HbpS family heme-binding protein n=1 Tax=Mesorhizobium sp. L2C084A000 TaxID=1287116 RepID=UPI0018CBECCE|nr:heme-binding protein [Mesorhizobium sp. L2C084A000]